MTLSNQGGPVQTIISIDGFNGFVFRNSDPPKDNIATTGSLVIGRPEDTAPTEDGNKIWRDEARFGLLRVDFDHLADFVSVDLICRDNDRASLRAYDSGGNLLAEDPFPPVPPNPDVCDGLGRGGLPLFFTASITRATADIAYILAGGRTRRRSISR